MDESATLIPSDQSGAPAYDEGELALITGSLRPVGTRMVDTNADRMVAARVTNRAINALPEGPTTAEVRQQTFARAVAASGGARLSADADRLARNAYELCEFALGRKNYSSMRQCFQEKHDSLLNSLNSDYWKAIKTGS